MPAFKRDKGIDVAPLIIVAISITDACVIGHFLIPQNGRCSVKDTIGKNEGYVFTTFNRNDLISAGESGANGMERFIDHVIYLVKKLGANKVGIGSDYQALGKYVPQALNQVSTYRQIRQGLKDAGLSDSEIGMISSGTFLSAMATHHFN